MVRPIINYTEIPDSNWFAGFASGEGCFLLNIYKSNEVKIGYIVQLIFKITQNQRDKKLLELIVKFLNCGTVYSHSKNALVFTVSSLADIIKVIIPIFKLYPIQGIKQLNYEDFCKVALLIDKKEHLNQKGLAQIRLIKERMNTKRN